MPIIVPPITGIINPQHFGKATEGVGKVFSRQHVHQRNEITIENPAHYAEILYDWGNPIAHVKVNWAAWEADVKAGVVKNKVKERQGLPQTYTARMGDYFVASGVVWLDYDKGLPTFEGNPAEMWDGLLNWLLSKPLFRDHAALVIPSSGFGKGGVPKFHAAFWLDVPAFSIKDFTHYWNALEGQALEQLGVTSDRAMQQPIQPIFGTRFTAIDDRWRTQIKPYVANVTTPVSWLRTLPTPEQVEAVKHPERTRAKREAGEREAAIIKKGGKSAEYEAEALLKFWLDHEATAAQRAGMGEFIGVVWAAQSVLGADRVYEIITSHPYADVSSKVNALDGLLDDTEHDYTLATLYYLAGERGYGYQSPMDVTPANATKVINAQYVGRALTGDYPRRALVKSYTGSGKTTLLGSLLATTRKQVLIIAPLKNLVYDITGELRRAGHDAQVYLAEDGKIKPTAEMREAKILVVTPQSAAWLLDRTHTISRYGLVWIEEVDQIIRAAIHPGNKKSDLYTQDHSHGFLSLVSATLKSGVKVWGVDAGLTQVSVDWFKSANTDVEVIVNEYTPDKAPLMVYPTLTSALKEGIKAAEAGKRVHFVTDTKDRDTGTRAIMRLLAEHGVKSGVKLVDADQDNADFMRDVNAALQGVQVLVSSPTLKSGVNITEWIPDVVVLAYTFLTPRDALQAANRTRQQGQVIAYFGMYRTLEPILTPVEVEARRLARYADMLKVTQGVKVERTATAALMDYLSDLETIDTQAQLQMPQRFAVRLFEQEGRKVVYVGSVGELSERDNEVRKQDPTLEEIRTGWPTIRAINRDNPPDKNMSVLDVRKGTVHSMIDGITMGGYDLGLHAPEHIYDVTHDGIRAGILERVTGIVDTGTRMIEQLHNPDYALDSIELDTAQEQAFGCLAEFVLEGELTAETLLEHGERFVRMVERVREAYNLCVGYRQRFELVYDPNDILGTARQLAANILSIAGLRLRRGDKRRIDNPQTGKRLHDWTVENADYARQLLWWRANGRNNQLREDQRKTVPLIALVFKQAASTIESEANADAQRAFMAMSESKQYEVIALIQDGWKVTEAVEAVLHPTEIPF